MRAQAIPLHESNAPYQVTMSHKSVARYNKNKSLKAITGFDDDNEDKTPPSSIGQITRGFKKIKESQVK